jgi:hypothetical protein
MQMKKRKLLILILISIGIRSYTQSLTCTDFKTGSFFIPTTEELKKFTVSSKDSINEYLLKRDEKIKRYSIIRKENTQLEWKEGIDNGKPEYETIEWIDDCTYRLKYSSEKNKLTPEKKWVNDNNGIVVSKIKISGKCMQYKAVMTTNDGRVIEQKGTLCKE